MHNKYYIFSILLVVLISSPILVQSHDGHSDDPTRTWSDRIETEDAYRFDLDVYEEDGKEVTSGEITQGSEIKVTILGNLTEIDVSSLEGLLLTDYTDYFQVTVDGASSEKFDTASAFLFLYPMIQDDGDGTVTNIFEKAVSDDNSLFFYPLVTGASLSIDGGDFIAELVNDDVTYKYNYDLDTGILNSFVEQTENHRIEISGTFSVDRYVTFNPLISIFLSSIVAISLRRKQDY